MKWGIVSAIALLAVPVAAGAQSISQKQADLEEALRQRQLICSGMADVKSRTGTYSDHQLAQCLIKLEEQRTEYTRFMAFNRLTATATASFR
jgi:hypothetical protein